MSIKMEILDGHQSLGEFLLFQDHEAEFESIFGRVRTMDLPYGSLPYNHTDRQIYTRRGGRGFYFEDPNGHLLEVMTVPETGS